MPYLPCVPCRWQRWRAAVPRTARLSWMGMRVVRRASPLHRAGTKRMMPLILQANRHNQKTALTRTPPRMLRTAPWTRCMARTSSLLPALRLRLRHPRLRLHHRWIWTAIAAITECERISEARFALRQVSSRASHPTRRSKRRIFGILGISAVIDMLVFGTIGGK